MQNPERYVWINMQERSIGTAGNYLLADTIDTAEGNASIASITKGSAAIHIKNAGLYLVIVRASIQTDDVSLQLQLQRYENGEYKHYRTIGETKTLGMWSMSTIMSITEPNTRIAINVDNLGSKSASVGSGTSLMIVPL